MMSENRIRKLLQRHNYVVDDGCDDDYTFWMIDKIEDYTVLGKEFYVYFSNYGFTFYITYFGNNIYKEWALKGCQRLYIGLDIDRRDRDPM